ncbi:MAG: C39 family peptidase [Candidatus Aminicenantales bacterium]
MNKTVRGILLALLLLFAGFDLGLLVGPSLVPAKTAGKAADSPAGLLESVPDVRQSTAYSCGAAALQAVLCYWGIEAREDSLMKALGTNEEAGTSPDNILRVAGENGLQASIREGMTLEDLERSVRAGIPVIADIQAWMDTPESGFSWAGEWEDGHYVIVLGIDERNVYVEDPSLLGTRGVIPRPEFVDRWHDYEGAPPHDATDRDYIRAGIVIMGREALSRPLYTRVD